MNLADRILQLIDNQSISVYKVEKALGLSKGRLYKILNDRRPLDSDLVEKVLSFFKLNPTDKYYVLTGESVTPEELRGSPPKFKIGLKTLANNLPETASLLVEDSHNVGLLMPGDILEVRKVDPPNLRENGELMVVVSGHRDFKPLGAAIGRVHYVHDEGVIQHVLVVPHSYGGKDYSIPIAKLTCVYKIESRTTTFV